MKSRSVNKYNGFLYGHYDSRGGATFVVSQTRKNADLIYLTGFGLEQVFDPITESDRLALAELELVEEDIIGDATLEVPFDPYEGEDLEWLDERPGFHLWVRVMGHIPFGEVTQLVVAEQCPDGFKESELGEDAYGVIFITKTEG